MKTKKQKSERRIRHDIRYNIKIADCHLLPSNSTVFDLEIAAKVLAKASKEILENMSTLSKKITI